jgi:hypothetical protein
LVTAKVAVRKTAALSIVVIALLMAMGFASRDWRSTGVQRDGIDAYDIHLKYYEEIRPSLVAGGVPVSALCNGQRMETASIME